MMNKGSEWITTTRQYDSLNRLTDVSSSSAVNFNYAYNNANQRVSVTNGDGTYWVYQYDVLGQVTSAAKNWPGGGLVAGQQFDYSFDSIGNRQTAAFGGDQNGANFSSASYGANLLNQYTNRTVPGVVDLMGSVNSNAAVTLNGQTPFTSGSYYRLKLPVDNTGGAIYPSITNQAVLGTNTVVITGNTYLPRTPEAFTYDLDGNLLSDGRFTYTWDAENRLTGIASLTNAPVASLLMEQMAYDDLGRCIDKKISLWNSASNAYQLATEKQYWYDGWNLIGELDGATHQAQTYCWGLDVSGSLQGAGGVGGLLWVNAGTNGVHYAAFDANGNVVALLSAADGSISAQYEYGPFGEGTRATGPMAKVNPFRFSTKYQDDETDFLYYGYRYYNPSTGRWIGRDPSEENGGPNLYVFAANNPINDIDILGLDNDAGPWTVGWQWLTGSGPGTQNFGPNDPFTLKLEQHQHIQDLLKQLDQQLAQQCANCVTTGPNGQDNYSLSGTKGIVLYVKDYSTLLTFGLTGNIAVTYLGSYALTYQVRSVSCKNGTANLHIHVVNVSSISSATHPPIIGYTQWWDNYIGQELNSLFSSGAMSPKTQIFDWDEPLKFKGNPCCTK